MVVGGSLPITKNESSCLSILRKKKKGSEYVNLNNIYALYFSDIVKII